MNNNERETWIIYIYIYFRTKVVILLIIKHIRVSRMNLKRNIAAELDKILTGLEIKNKTTRIIIFFKGNVIRVEINVILNKVATFSQSNFCIAVQDERTEMQQIIIKHASGISMQLIGLGATRQSLRIDKIPRPKFQFVEIHGNLHRNRI